MQMAYQPIQRLTTSPADATAPPIGRTGFPLLGTSAANKRARESASPMNARNMMPIRRANI